MPSKTSKKPHFRQSLWKSAQNCAESEFDRIAREFAAVIRPGDRVLLEGEMGVGKTTFARSLLEGLGIIQPPEGSPSFAIAHEYQSPKGAVVHVDFYRLKNESEIEEAGIDAYFWERDATVISEWTSMFPSFENAVLEKSAKTVWVIRLEFSGAERRNILIEQITRISSQKSDR
jgi:tRNA threonylcarbamoyl adenosine modification protein YjeE